MALYCRRIVRVFIYAVRSTRINGKLKFTAANRRLRQIYENAKRKDSSCMQAQIILNDNAKDKKMIKPQIMLHYRKVKSDIHLHTYALTAGWGFVYVTYRTCDRQRQSVV